MNQKSYRFKFYLNAMHEIIIAGLNSGVHPHTWEVVIFIESDNDNFFQFTELEKDVQLYLSIYEEQLLNEIPPFDVIVPTLENIGEVIFKQINNVLKGNSWQLNKLEISENPSRTYVLSMEEVEDAELKDTENYSSDYDLDDKDEDEIDIDAYKKSINKFENSVNFTLKEYVDAVPVEDIKDKLKEYVDAVSVEDIIDKLKEYVDAVSVEDIKDKTDKKNKRRIDNPISKTPAFAPKDSKNVLIEIKNMLFSLQGEEVHKSKLKLRWFGKKK